jgi:3-oxoacyl-[acyl-carrier protein] reductase
MLQNKTVLITGGSRGIGAAIVQKCLEAGAQVAFTYQQNAEKAQALVQELAPLFPNQQIKAYQSDAKSTEQAQKVVEQVLADFGSLQVLINNAGITQDNLLMRLSEAQWDEVIDTNLKSVFNYCKAVMRPMLKAKAGSIINISSIVGLKGNPGQTNYAASKAGMLGFTKSLAQEMGARNIRCNVVAPGFIETDMTNKLDEATQARLLSGVALQRLGTPQEVAQVVVFLASDYASYITGEVIQVTGGM